MTGAIHISRSLWERVQLALGMTQVQLAAFMRVNRRTIQRWNQRSGIPMTADLLRAAALLDPVQPELAAEVRALASQDPTSATEPYVIARILEAAAAAVGMTPEAVTPAVEAAFRMARAQGASVHGMVLGLEERT